MSVLLPRLMVERPWGCTDLPAPFEAAHGQRIGEIWFEPPPALDTLLVKYIFTAQALSVQVHPDDRQAGAAGGGPRGKEECWLVIAADPGARLGVGFRHDVDSDTIRAAALDGSIESMLEWHGVTAGDFIHIPPGTVHAIGGGISLIEVQQNSDITYRLYDYGRGRELHLDAGLAVARGCPHDPALRRHLPARGSMALVDGPHFRLDRIESAPNAATASRYAGALLAIPLDAAIRVAGEEVKVGECGLSANLAEIAFAAGGLCLIAQSCEG